MDDVRFKVKAGDFDNGTPARGKARVFCFLVGRGQDGRRECVRGWVRPGAELSPDESWSIRSSRFESLESMLCEKDLFSEETAPAGF